MRLRLAPTIFLMSACAGHFRTELVGHGTAAIIPRGVTPATGTISAAPGSGSIQLARGTYDLALHFDLPRAQVIDWAVTCPGANVTGSIGEPFAAYRERRLAQLRAQRDQDRRNVASLTGAMIGAVAPSVSGHVETPGARVDARVSGQAAGQVAGSAIADAAIDDRVELPAGDYGQGRLQTIVHISTEGDGLCAVTASADDQTVLGIYEVTRVRDLDAEARLRVMAANTAARQVRTQLTTQLVGYGADVNARRLRLEAEAHARIEAEAVVASRHEAEVAVAVEHHEAEVSIEIRQRGVALNARAELRAQLVMWGADPDRRARLVAQARAEREAREAHLRAEIELRDRQEQEREAAIAAFEARQLELALSVRGELRSYLVSLGAKERPPMPPLRRETPGLSPFDGASWIAGRWIWGGDQWSWEAGGWRDTGRFGETGGDVTVGGSVGAGMSVGINASSDNNTNVRDHRSTSEAPSTSPVRDHRGTLDVPGVPSTPTVRDHREDPPRHVDAPIVRDHRSEAPSRPAPSSNKTDDKPSVRDHRR